jgi:hypothetical protein
MTRHFHGASHLGTLNVDRWMPAPTPSLVVDSAYVDRLAIEWQMRLQLAEHHNKPLVRIHELQKQILLLKTMKVSMQ